MSQYVYEVAGGKPMTVVTGLDLRHQRFYAQVYVGDDLSGTPLHSFGAANEELIAKLLGDFGIPMSLQAYDCLSKDHNDSIFGAFDIQRRFALLPPVHVTPKNADTETRKGGASHEPISKGRAQPVHRANREH